MQVSTDPELLAAILENMLLNAFEAGGDGTVVLIRIGRDDAAGRRLSRLSTTVQASRKSCCPVACLSRLRPLRMEAAVSVYGRSKEWWPVWGAVFRPTIG